MLSYRRVERHTKSVRSARSIPSSRRGAGRLHTSFAQVVRIHEPRMKRHKAPLRLCAFACSAPKTGSAGEIASTPAPAPGPAGVPDLAPVQLERRKGEPTCPARIWDVGRTPRPAPPPFPSEGASHTPSPSPSIDPAT